MNERDHDGWIHRFCAIIKDHGRKYVLGTCYKGLKYVAEYFAFENEHSSLRSQCCEMRFFEGFSNNVVNSAGSKIIFIQ